MGPALRRSAAHKPSPWVGQHDPPYEDVARRRRGHHAEGTCLRSPGEPPLLHDESPACPPSRARPSLSRARSGTRRHGPDLRTTDSPTSPVRRTPAFVPREVWRRPSPRPASRGIRGRDGTALRQREASAPPHRDMLGRDETRALLLTIGVLLLRWLKRLASRGRASWRSGAWDRTRKPGDHDGNRGHGPATLGVPEGRSRAQLSTRASPQARTRVLGSS